MCPVCKGIDHIPVGNALGEYRLMRCRSCGTVAAHPRPTPGELMHFYNVHDEYNSPPAPLSAATAKRRAARIAACIRRHAPAAASVLEIGCLHGHLLHGLRQHGFSVAGADICDSARQYALSTYGVTVHPGEVPPPSLEGGFDVLILSHVVEHLIAPVDFLRNASRFLKPGGLCLMEVPGLDTPLFRLFGEHFNMVKPPEHINFFDHDSGRALHGQAGLDVVATQTYSPILEQRTVYFYFLLSLANALGIMRAMKKKHSSHKQFGLASPLPPGKMGWLGQAMGIADIACRALSVATFPLIRLADRMGKGLFLVVVSQKTSDLK